jgi:predicted transcriptional regulator
MSTLSVPLTPELEKFVVEHAAESGLSKADIMRQALKKYREDKAVANILRAMQEPDLTGDLRELMKQID